MKEGHPVGGSCLCGLVTFKLSELNRDVVVCHCVQCRKQTGHMVAATRVLDEHLSIKGEEHLTWFASSESAQRGFCKTCGSLLFWKATDSAQTSVMAGSLDAPTGLETACHIYTDYKGDYYDIADGKPQHKSTD